MADNNHGGKREGAGRPSKADEVKLIEKLTPMAPAAYKAMKEGIDRGDYKFVQLFFAYYAGKPKESKDITSQGEKIQTIINLGTGDE